MPARSTAASVALTLGFHLAALTYGLFLLFVFCFTGSTVLLLLVCLLSGSSHGVRMFVAFLWRTEMRINALASREKPPRERRSPHPNDHRPQLDQEPTPARQSQPQREVTATVMIASLIYFLLFKWILNIVFTAIPLLLWFIAVVQLLPADNSLGIDSFVGSDNTFAKLFTAVAFAFFAHQLGVSASRGLVFVSDKMTQFLFDTANASSDTASRAAATFQPMLFADGPGFAEMQPIQPNAERGRDEPVVGAPGKSYKMASSDELEIDEDVDGDDLSEHEQHEINTAEIATESSDDMRTEKYVELKEREHYAHDINRTADENIGLQQSQLEKGKHHSAPEVLSANSRAATGRDIKRIKSSVSSTTSSHSRRRPIGIASDQELRFDSKSSSSRQDTVAKRDEDADQSVNFVTPSQAAPPMDLEVTDSEIYRAYGSVPRYDDDDVQHLRAFDPTADPERPLQYVSSIDVERRVRDIEYDSFSPMGTPTGFRTGNMVGSFISNPPEYDAMSPTNSIQDGEFPSEKFQQVYRSIRQPSSEAVSASRFDEMGFNDDVISRRDRVNFNAFAPPSVCPSVTSFIYSVWAFLLSQRAELHERVATELPEARKLSLDAKMDLRRGALVHVTLDVPSGFRILNGATQGFLWEGKLSNVQFEVACSEDAAIGPVLFKAKIVVGAEVAVLRSYVVVSSRKLDYRSNRDEPEMLDSSLEILEKSYEEIPYRSLELKELVGQGYFGDAYRALYNGEEVVVKTIRASEFGETSTQIVKEFQHEAAVLNMFGHHPCIVPFVGASTDDHFPLCLVTKYLPYGSLEDRLKHPTSESSYSVAQKTGMLKDAAAGLLNVHEGGFIHRDIAARNCLVDDDLRVRICDFGLCRRVMNESGSGLMRDAFGPVKYMAPESLQPPHVFSYSSDSYMFGVLMWETFSSSPPFPSMAPVEAMLRITRGERLAVPSSLPEELRLLMETCFRDEPTERPLMGEILQALDESFADMNRKASGFIAAGAAATASFSKNLSRRDRSIFA